MNKSSLALLDFLIRYLATLTPLNGDRGERARVENQLGILLQLRLELAAEAGRYEPDALRENHARMVNMIAGHFHGTHRIHTRLMGRGIGQVWVWLCPTPVLRSAASRKVTPRSRGDPGSGGCLAHLG